MRLAEALHPDFRFTTADFTYRTWSCTHLILPDTRGQLRASCAAGGGGLGGSAFPRRPKKQGQQTLTQSESEFRFESKQPVST